VKNYFPGCTGGKMRFPLLRDGREIVSRVVLVRGFGTLGFLHGPSRIYATRPEYQDCQYRGRNTAFAQATRNVFHPDLKMV